MQIRPTQQPTPTVIRIAFNPETSIQFAQHESETSEHDERVHQPQGMCLLLDIPAESLTHVTSSLEPPALLALSIVNRALHAHVKDDNTWYRAFAHQLLGVSPEHDLDSSKTLMLRRSEVSWRREFLLRFTLQRRWEFSPNTSITHVPHHSPVKSIHLTPSGLLLASSLQYGVVSRSLPFTGKVLRGYLDASGTGLGVGNPNAEFTPNVTTCAISSEGGTAKILWGLVNGDVRLLCAAKAGDARASQQLYLPNGPEETHRGAVLDTVWDEGKPDRAASCAMDGSVKVWDTKTMRCLWTSQCEPGEWAYKATTNLSQGIMACATSTRHVLVWRGVDSGLVPITLHRIKPLTEQADHPISMLHIDPYGQGNTVLVAHEGEAVFYRVTLRENQDPEVVQFGDKGAAALTSIRPVFARSLEDSSFIVTGDTLGYISIYPWSFPPSSPHPSPSPPSSFLTTVSSLHTFEAFPASSITALTWTPTSLLAGSASGSVRIFSPLPPFAPLRTLGVQKDKWRAGGQARERSVGMIVVRSVSNPSSSFQSNGNGNRNGGSHGKSKEETAPKPPTYEEEEIVVCAGDSVLAFRAGAVPLSGGRRGGVRGRNTSGTVAKRGKRKVDPRWMKNTELTESITESRKLLEMEHKELQASFGRAREHRGALEELGLSEAEAVEYLLMLSREEEERRAMFGPEDFSPDISAGDFSSDIPAGDGEGGILVDDFEELGLGSGSSSGFDTGSSSCSAWGIQPATFRETDTDTLDTPTIERASNPISVPNNTMYIDPSPGGTPGNDADTDFPSISSSASSSSSSVKAGSAWGGRAGGSGTGSWKDVVTSGRSPTVGMGMRIGGSSANGTSSSGGSSWGSPPRVGSRSSAVEMRLSPSKSPAGESTGVDEEEEMDTDLRFAIELSLAEARSLKA